MSAELERTLMGTTLTSSLSTHQHLKNLKAVFGCNEDIISRFAVALSLRTGSIHPLWVAESITQGLTVINGKSIRGKTLFKTELSLFLVMLAVAEPEVQEHQVREKIRLHWERGVELMAQGLGDEDWLEYLYEQFR